MVLEALQFEPISQTNHAEQLHLPATRNVSSEAPFQAKLDGAMNRISPLGRMGWMTNIADFLSFSFATRTEQFNDYTLSDRGGHPVSQGDNNIEKRSSESMEIDPKKSAGNDMSDNEKLQKWDSVSQKITLQNSLIPYIGNALNNGVTTKMGETMAHPGSLGQLIDELVEHMSLVRSRGKVSLSMTLKPGELGEMKLTATEENGKITLLFQASRDARIFLEDNRAEIAHALENKGITLGHMDVQSDSSQDSGDHRKNPFIAENLAYNFMPQSEKSWAQNNVLANTFFVRFTVMASA